MGVNKLIKNNNNIKSEFYWNIVFEKRSIREYMEA